MPHQYKKLNITWVTRRRAIENAAIHATPNTLYEDVLGLKEPTSNRTLMPIEFDKPIENGAEA